MNKRMLALMLALAMLVGVQSPALAADDGQSKYQLVSFTVSWDDVEYTPSDALLGELGTTRYTYNAEGRLIREVYTDEDGGKTTQSYTYDENGNQTISEVDYGNGSKYAMHYTYDANGNLLTETVVSPGWSSDGDKVTYTYDSSSRLIRKERLTHFMGMQSTSTTTYTYVGNSKWPSESDDGTVSTYTYDADGNVLTETSPYWRIVNTYDANGNVLSMTENSLSDSRRWYRHTYTYDASDNLLRHVYAYSYFDEFDQTQVSGEMVYTYTLQYDANGNLLKSSEQLDGRPRCTYTYTYAAVGTPGLSNFQKGSTYQAGTFTDVPAGIWYAANVATAYEYGLMNGQGNGLFNPGGDIKLSETVTIVARLHSIYTRGAVPASFSEAASPWYQPYVTYAGDEGLLAESSYEYGQAATREQFAVLLANAFGGSELEQINRVDDGAIPDVPADSPAAEAIYTLYRAGILTGSTPEGDFLPQSSIKRSEAAAILSRMVDRSMRQSIELIAQ